MDGSIERAYTNSQPLFDAQHQFEDNSSYLLHFALIPFISENAAGRIYLPDKSKVIVTSYRIEDGTREWRLVFWDHNNNDVALLASPINGTGFTVVSLDNEDVFLDMLTTFQSQQSDAWTYTFDRLATDSEITSLRSVLAAHVDNETTNVTHIGSIFTHTQEDEPVVIDVHITQNTDGSYDIFVDDLTEISNNPLLGSLVYHVTEDSVQVQYAQGDIYLRATDEAVKRYPDRTDNNPSEGDVVYKARDTYVANIEDSLIFKLDFTHHHFVKLMRLLSEAYPYKPAYDE